MLERISRRLVQVVQVSFSPTKCSSARFLLVVLEDISAMPVRKVPLRFTGRWF